MKTIKTRKPRKKKFFKIIFSTLLFVAAAIFLFTFLAKKGIISQKTIAIEGLSMLSNVVQFLPVEKDTKKEIDAVDQLVQFFDQRDGVERRYLLLLQNNMELRPGGGFLGQYAVVKVKDGEVTSLTFEDANLLDQRISAKITPPYPFERMMQIKKWKFRDSNFSPDFSENVEKAKYFYRLSGGNSEFDAVIAVNATVLNKVLELTGPIEISSWEFNSENAVLKLEEVVEKPYLFDETLDTQNRKWVMKKMAPIIVERLFSLGNIKKVADLGLEELRNKDVMLNFTDPDLQALVESVGWGGKVDQDWTGDYLMLVDANMGALKSDYYLEREVFYSVDLSGEKPFAKLEYTYTHNAEYGDWRTSDYHSYLRVYVPQGSELVERKMVSYPNIQEDFGKSYFGFIAHTLIGQQTLAEISYNLPESVRDGDYKLLIQKQSGVGDVPIKVHLKTKDGEEFDYEGVLKKDLELEFQK